ncbi:MAG: hypothetical protein RL015_3584 [Verrucomicrobiota bacterium]
MTSQPSPDLRHRLKKAGQCVVGLTPQDSRTQSKYTAIILPVPGFAGQEKRDALRRPSGDFF